MKNNLKPHLYAVIICGGGGTRLWPRSRDKNPKQFSKLFDEQTLFQKTVKRLAGLVTPDHIFCITTSANYAQEIKKEAPAIPAKNILAEPMRRNTAMACGLGALLVKNRDPQGIMLNLWADHLVSKPDVLRQVELAAAQAAFDGQNMAAIGIKPTHPHTGYGYLRAGKLIQKINNTPVYKLVKFTEKPDLQTAQKFLKTGRYFWNSGMYVWQAAAFLKAMQKYTPAIGQALNQIEKSFGTKKMAQVLKTAYEKAPSLSVDVAVSEKAPNFLMVPAQMGWNDVGDWSVIYELSPKDKQGNVTIKYGRRGEALMIDSQNNLVQFDDQLIALVGVNDLIIVDTTDALLICPREKAQDVKKLVEQLKEKNKKTYL